MSLKASAKGRTRAKVDLERRRLATKKKLQRIRKHRRVNLTNSNGGISSTGPLKQHPSIGGLTFKNHDVLVIPPEGVLERDELFRFPVVKPTDKTATRRHGSEVGKYVDFPETLDSYDYTDRRAFSIARPGDWGEEATRDLERGPAFVTLPVKPEPSASFCGLCYMIDAQNLNFINAWTAEEWSAFSPEDDPAAPTASADTFEVLLGGPRGKVFRVVLNIRVREAKLTNGHGAAPDKTVSSLNKIDVWPPGTRQDLDKNAGFIECIDLRYQPEVWNLLRNGCVAGTAALDTRFTSENRQGHPVIPLVNVTTLMPAEARQSRTLEGE